MHKYSSLEKIPPEKLDEICRLAFSKIEYKLLRYSLKHLHIDDLGLFFKGKGRVFSGDNDSHVLTDLNFPQIIDDRMKKTGDEILKSPLNFINCFISIVIQANQYHRLQYKLFKFFYTRKEFKNEGIADEIKNKCESTVKHFSYGKTALKKMQIVLDREKNIDEIIISIVPNNNVLLTPICTLSLVDNKKSCIQKIFKELSQKQILLAKDKNSFCSLFYVDPNNEVELNYPIYWNNKQITLVYLFFCLIDFDIIKKDEFTSLLPKLSKTFCNEKGTFPSKSLAKAAERLDYVHLSTHDIFEIKPKGLYRSIYDIVKVSSEI